MVICLERGADLHMAQLPLTVSSYSITERRVPELIPVLGSQPAGDVHTYTRLTALFPGLLA